MKLETKTALLGRAALFCAALIWGSSFIIVKNTVEVASPILLIAIRFTIACLVLSLIFYKKLKMMDTSYLKSGFVIGLLLFLAFTVQTIGITDTTPGKNAFLTAIYCVLVPYLFWIVNKTKPDKYNFIAAITCMVGIGFVCLNSNLSISMGDSLTLVGGVLYAAHIVAVAKITKKKDPVLVTIVQFGYTAIFAWIAVFSTKQSSITTLFNTEIIFSILYLAFFCTAVALLLQTIGQKNTPPAQASIILCLEAVFGVFFSVLFYHEKVTIQLLLGFVLILISVVISETKLSFLQQMRVNVKVRTEE